MAVGCDSLNACESKKIMSIEGSVSHSKSVLRCRWLLSVERVNAFIVNNACCGDGLSENLEKRRINLARDSKRT